MSNKTLDVYQSIGTQRKEDQGSGRESVQVQQMKVKML